MQTNSVKELTWKQIKAAGRTLSVPFQLRLEDHAEPLIIEKIVRLIPKKRFVAFGKFKDKPVVAKCFLEHTVKNRKNKKETHANRDAQGVNILQTANVPTPALLMQATDVSHRISVLIFERLFEAYSLEWLWQQKSTVEELAPLMRAATIELATQHVLGIIQRDLHLKNFLISNKKIYTLDGGSIEQFNEPFSKKESLQHLALFFSQLGAGTENLQKELFDLYTQSRGWILKPVDYEFLKTCVKKWDIERSKRYQKKILRNSSAFSRVERFASFIMYDREYFSKDFFHLLKNPEIAFQKKEHQILKAGNSSTVIKTTIGAQTVVIKRYNIKNMLHWLRRTLRPSRAYRSWQLAHTLLHASIPTAKPIAFIEKHFLGFRHRSYFMMEYVSGKHLGDYFAHFREEDPDFKEMAVKVVQLIQHLAELHLTHGDLKMTNIIIHQNRPLLIDLDGMQFHRTHFSLKNAVQKELDRLMANWQNPRVTKLFQDVIQQEIIPVR